MDRPTALSVTAEDADQLGSPGEGAGSRAPAATETMTGIARHETGRTPSL